MMNLQEELEDLKRYREERQAILDMPDEDFAEYERRIMEGFASTRSQVSESPNANQLGSHIPNEGATNRIVREEEPSRHSRQNNQALADSATHGPIAEDSMNTSNATQSDGSPLGDVHDERDKHRNAGILQSKCPETMPANNNRETDSTMPILEVSSSSSHQRRGARDKLVKKDVVHVSSPSSASFASNITTPTATPNLTILGTKPQGRRAQVAQASAREISRQEKARKQAEALAQKKEREEEGRMTPSMYAAKLQTKFRAVLESTPIKKQFMKGKVIFYVGGDHSSASRSTREKMDFITKKGGIVAANFDPNAVTHIVTETQKDLTLKALGLKSLKEIPDHIPTVTWNWVTSGNKGSSELASRGKDKGKQKEVCQVSTADADLSRISEFTPEKCGAGPSAPAKGKEGGLGVRNSTSKKRPAETDDSISSYDHTANSSEDPLAEFYAQAISDKDAEWSHFGVDKYNDELDPKDLPGVSSAQKSVFTCDQKRVNTGSCINQDIVDKELMELHQAKLSDGDKWRAHSYAKTIRAIRAYPKRIQSYAEALAIRGVGNKTALKIKEIIDTGELQRIKYERTDEVASINIFKGIYGVGPKIAHTWYAAGCRTLDDIKARKGGITLSAVQEIGVKFYDDINSRMPRNEAADIFNMIKSVALSIDPKLFVEIMGSFRRGKADCGDIDILITRPHDDGKTHEGVMTNLLRQLHERNILTEDLVLPEDMYGLEATYRGLCRRDSLSPHRRIDILAVPYECRGAALLYYTGDDIFNRAMRYKASKMGFSLNHRALSASVIRSTDGKRVKLTLGTVVASETEEEIFRMLGVPWQEPHERVRNLA